MADHGTANGRRAHVRHGTPICDPCRLAWNAYNRERRSFRADRGRRAMRILRDRYRLEYLDIMFQLRKADDE